MHTRMRTATCTAAAALAITLALAPAAFGQTGDDTGMPGTGGSFTGTDTTGPDAPLTLGTGADAQFTDSGGSGYLIDEDESLAETGGGEMAIAAGSLLMATGAGLRLYGGRRKR